jgi:SAM-dependent methyltransferase
MAETWSMPLGSGDRWPEDYERGRPGWPSDSVLLPGLPRSATVLDLGAGTGKLTRLLVPAYARVVAVEPSHAMRRILEAAAPPADIIRGTAQDIPLADASVDGVFAAQAFHWFDDEQSIAELIRVLRPGGAVVLLFNVPAGPWEPSSAAAEALLLERGGGDVSYIPLDLGDPFQERGLPPLPAGPFEPVRATTFPNPQRVDREGLVSFYASMGWLADLPDEERLPLLEDVGSLLPASAYARSWQTNAYWTRRERI